MHGYKEFSGDVKKILDNIINTYSLKVCSENNHTVIFKSDKCILQISTEYTYAEILFKEKENDKWMILGPYLKTLYPNERVTFTDSSQKIQKDAIISSLKDLGAILEKYGKPFLTGDFSWRDEYEKQL